MFEVQNANKYVHDYHSAIDTRSENILDRHFFTLLLKKKLLTPSTRTIYDFFLLKYHSFNVDFKISLYYVMSWCLEYYAFTLWRWKGYVHVSKFNIKTIGI